MLDYVSWYMPNRIIISRYSGYLTADDVRAGTKAFLQLIKDGQKPYVHGIVDASMRGKISPDLLNLKEAQKLAKSTISHEMVGWMLVIDPDPHPVMNFIGTALSQLADMRFRVFDTKDKALAFLYQVDRTLSMRPLLPEQSAAD